MQELLWYHVYYKVGVHPTIHKKTFIDGSAVCDKKWKFAHKIFFRQTKSDLRDAVLGVSSNTRYRYFGKLYLFFIRLNHPIKKYLQQQKNLFQLSRNSFPSNKSDLRYGDLRSLKIFEIFVWKQFSTKFWAYYHGK